MTGLPSGLPIPQDTLQKSHNFVFIYILKIHKFNLKCVVRTENLGSTMQVP